MNALHGARLAARATSRTKSASASPAERRRQPMPTRIGNEVEALYTNGPAGGGGATRSVREVLACARRSCRETRCSAVSISRRRDMMLRDVAHARAGDKGTHRQLLGDRVRRARLSVAASRSSQPNAYGTHLGALIDGEVVRYLLPGIGAMNFVVSQAAGDRA